MVGGGHNGLTCAAYLARAGLRVCVLERRDVLGGACVTEELWPGQRVSRASYVVSMLQPKVVSDLRLHDFGYEPIPLDPSYATFGPDGEPILFHHDTGAHAGGARALLEARTPRPTRATRRCSSAPPSSCGRCCSGRRPRSGRSGPATCSALLREAGRAAGLARRDVHELFRVMTMSVGDLLDDWFETDALKGAIASTGVVGVWAGPRTPGTAYNLLHHELGELNGVRGRVGPRRAEWAASARRWPRARSRTARRPHRRRRCARSTCATAAPRA